MKVNQPRLMACGTLCCKESEQIIMRGMKLFDKHAHALGRVAAVQEQEGYLTHILLNSQPCLRIPISFIESIESESIYLKLEETDLKSLK